MACLFAAAALVACDPNEGTIKTVSVNITVDESKLPENLVPDTYNVTVTNTASGAVVEAETENGMATLSVVPGIYTVVVSADLSEGGFTYFITGSVKDAEILADGVEIAVEMGVVKESQLVIKESYYTGCTYKTSDTEEATYFRDQFHEIYNNSNEVAYVDGLCIAYTVFANYKYDVFYTYTGYNKNDYVFVQYIWQIPGDGQQYPLQPGESIVIAQWATNHKADILTKNTSPVDLSGAEFEAIEGEKTLWNATITDGPAVNMTFAVDAKGYGLQQWMVPTGGANLIIFKPSTPLRTADFLVSEEDPSSNSKAHEVAVADILDAVQSIDDDTRIQTLGMPSILDAGYIWCSGTYIGESISRKQIGTLENGSPKYADTNNTSNDFEVQKTPMIRRNGAKVPSWNTWNK